MDAVYRIQRKRRQNPMRAGAGDAHGRLIQADHPGFDGTIAQQGSGAPLIPDSNVPGVFSAMREGRALAGNESLLSAFDSAAVSDTGNFNAIGRLQYVVSFAVYLPGKIRSPVNAKGMELLIGPEAVPFHSFSSVLHGCILFYPWIAEACGHGVQECCRKNRGKHITT